MTDPSTLSRREREIMDLVYAQRRATVSSVHAAMKAPPTKMAVRRTMHILEEKGHLKRVRSEAGSASVVYAPVVSRGRVGVKAFQDLLHTFFDDSLEQALAAHFVASRQALSKEEKERLLELIEEAQESDSDHPEASS